MLTLDVYKHDTDTDINTTTNMRTANGTFTYADRWMLLKWLWFLITTVLLFSISIHDILMITPMAENL